MVLDAAGWGWDVARQAERLRSLLVSLYRTSLAPASRSDSIYNAASAWLKLVFLIMVANTRQCFLLQNGFCPLG